MSLSEEVIVNSEEVGEAGEMAPPQALRASSPPEGGKPLISLPPPGEGGSRRLTDEGDAFCPLL